MWIVYILLGTISVVTAVLILRHELKKAILSIPKMPSGESFKKELDEVNSSFFEIANDLEGKYSVHEKQIQDLEEKVIRLLSDQARLMNASSSRASSPPETTNLVPSAEYMQVETSEASRRFERRSTDRASSETKDKRQQEAANRIGLGISSRGVRLERTRQSDYAIAREAKTMLDKGNSLPEVAKQLGIGVGELKLILGVNIARE